MRRLFISILLGTLSTAISSQDHTVNQLDLLFYGGLQFEHMKRYEQGDKNTTWSLNTGTEFFCFRWLSIGVDLNYGNAETSYQALKDAELYTTPYLNIYYYRMFYLNGAYTYHRTIEQNFAYPYSHEEHTFSLGAGKKFFINKHLLVDLGARFYNSKKYGIDSDGYRLTKKTIGMSLDARLLIYFKPGSKNKNESN